LKHQRTWVRLDIALQFLRFELLLFYDLANMFACINISCCDWTDFHSNLTHVLPHVCKQFYALLKRSDFLWLTALERLVKNEAFLWKEGLQNLIVDCKMEVQNSHNTPNINRGTIGSSLEAARREPYHPGQEPSNPGGDTELLETDGNASYEQKLVAAASKALVAAPSFRRDLTEEQRTEKDLLVHQWVFRHVVSNHLRYRSPVFYMPETVRLNREVGLHFFEPRYRLLISEVMSRFPVSARRGEPIVVESKRDYPSFVYAHKSPLAPTSPACIVQVRQCLIHPNGTADACMVPSAYVWIDRVTARPSSGGLTDVRVIRMGQAASTAMQYKSEYTSASPRLGR
jgi:hypothetical protein